MQVPIEAPSVSAQIPFDSLRVGVVHLSATGAVQGSNHQLASIFPGLQIAGRQWIDVLNDADKFGLIVSGVAVQIDDSVRAARAASVFTLKDS